MGRYAKSTIRLDFPDLSEDDDPIFVTIRNPKTLPIERLMPAEDGGEVVDGIPVDKDAATRASFGVMAGLITDWHVYDGTLDADDTPPLPLPATADTVRLLPFEIQQELMNQIKAVTTSPQ